MDDLREKLEALGVDWHDDAQVEAKRTGCSRRGSRERSGWRRTGTHDEEEVRMRDDQGAGGQALPREWESVVEDCSWPRARDVALRCLRHSRDRGNVIGYPEGRAFNGVRRDFKDCTHVNLILRQKWLTAYIKGDKRDWEAEFGELYGACPEVWTWWAGVSLHGRNPPEVTAIMRWVELW